jgi:subtilase family serine protease
VYSLSGLSPSSGAGAGQTMAIVDAYHDPQALADLNKFNAQYGYPQLAVCRSLSQAGPCFKQADPQGKPAVNSGWALEESLDIQWAHAQAPAAKIVLVEAANASFSSLLSAVSYANSIGATEVSMSWGGRESISEAVSDSYLAQPGTFYTASAGDSGHAAQYPAASPNVIAVGGTTLNGCGGTSCAHFSSETTWSGSGGGASADEPIPVFQASYHGPVSGAATIAILTTGARGIPDVSFDANPSTGVSVYDSISYNGQSGWFTLGGTSVGAPNWAGILAAGAAAGKTALQGNVAIYSGGYRTNLRDVTSGTNGSCGSACTAGPGYDLVTGLGSPVNYP